MLVSNYKVEIIQGASKQIINVECEVKLPNKIIVTSCDSEAPHRFEVVLGPRPRFDSFFPSPKSQIKSPPNSDLEIPRKVFAVCPDSSPNRFRVPKVQRSKVPNVRRVY